MVSDTRYRQNFPPFPLVQCWKMSISSTEPDRGILSIFWAFQTADRDPSTSFLFIITNYQLGFPSFSIHLAQQFTQKYRLLSHSLFSQISKYHSYFPSRHSITLSTLSYPYPGVYFPLTKISQNTSLYPLLHIHPQISHFPSKIPKKWLKIAIFQSVAHSVTS